MQSVKKHYLYPSALFSHKEPHIVSTVLGSCVAVCLWDKERQWGGINHFLLPLWNGQGLASPKYGNISIGMLIKKMENMGSNRKDMIAKLFGGAHMNMQYSDTFMIGVRNVELAQDELKEAGIKIVSEHVGGDFGRNILYHTATGEVLLKRTLKNRIKM